MQYWQRRLQRSVTESRRLRSGRPKRSIGSIDTSLSLNSAILGLSRRGALAMRRSRWTGVCVATAVFSATLFAQNQAPKPAPADRRVEKVKTEAAAAVDGMSVFTQQMVDTI